MKHVLWKLLRKHVSVPQLVGFGLANLVGLAIVLLAVQFYQDLRPVFNDDESFIRKDYLIITRAVTGAGTMMGNSGEFDEQAIAEIEQQPWCRQVGRFVPSEFGIGASLGLGKSGKAMRSQFFFESIPNDFIDADPQQWVFDPQSPEVPVIVSREYLSLYNFGFAASQGMPKISEGQAGMIPLQFTLTGNGLREVMPGRIVGFSNRLNTVIVPQEFLQWANRRYGPGTTPLPVRLIVEVSNPGDVQIEEFMNEHHYDVAGDKMTSSRANYFLTVIIAIVIAVGVIISALAFFVLILSIYLLLQKNTRKIQNLLMLGYSPREVARPFIVLVVGINVAVYLMGIALMLLGRLYYIDMIAAFGVNGSGLWVSLTVGLVLMGLITAGNVVAINRKVTGAFFARTAQSR